MEVNERGLPGKTVVITGASSGAGRATALEMAQRGARVVLAARREAALLDVAAECEALGARTKVVVTDVTDAAAVAALAGAAVEWTGGIDIWVNNAGVLAAGTFEETPVSIHDQVIRVNLMGYIHGAHAVVPYFKKQGHGVLINNISVGGWLPTPYAVGYSASKFGLRAYAEALRGELEPWPHIHVCDLYPAFLDTPGIQHAANFTGKILRPAPPVYDPASVARKIADIAENPRNRSVIGPAEVFLKVAYALFPNLTRKATGGVIRKYLEAADSAPHTEGNIFQPAEYGSSIHGGWRLPPSERQKALRKVLVVAGLFAGVLLLGRKG